MKRFGIKRIATGFSVIFTASVFIIAFTPITNLMSRPLIMEESLEKSDLIVVLGGGAYPNGVLGDASNERLLHGLVLYKDGFAPSVMFVGGSILDVPSKVIHTLSKGEEEAGMDAIESRLMYDISRKLGIPEEVLFVDAASTHTYSNLLAVKRFMDEKKLKSCLLVTSPTHMQRSFRVSKRLGLGCSPAPISDYTPHIKSAIGRLCFFYEVLWEYLGITLYKAYGYI